MLEFLDGDWRKLIEKRSHRVMERITKTGFQPRDILQPQIGPFQKGRLTSAWNHWEKQTRQWKYFVV